MRGKARLMIGVTFANPKEVTSESLHPQLFFRAQNLNIGVSAIVLRISRTDLDT